MGYIFGPVPSRRLGRSLGVDLVPFKTCSYDCIYCQLGKTTCKTVERKEWVPLEELLGELKDKLATNPDYITLSGSGEPTLFSRLEELIDRIHGLTRIPIAVLTNGSMLWQPEVRKSLRRADLVLPSLDAGDPMRFQCINRPHESITFEKMVEGLIAFRKDFPGQYWLEVFLLSGYTAIESEVIKLNTWIEKIRPDRVQLNTVTRPPAEYFAERVLPSQMERFAGLFNPPGEIIAEFHGVAGETAFAADLKDVLEMLARRPCSMEDICDGLKLHRNQVVKYLEELMNEAGVISSTLNGKKYYQAVGSK
jgi:wyosine [tRNA(Phe)-imidazoG37] synthetase (radical SAM superfamily)